MKRKELVERRRYKRFLVQEGAFAVFGSHVSEVGQIIDISRDGLSFRYIANGDRDRANGSSELEIYLAEKSFCLEKVPVKTVWDFEMADQFPSSPMTMRRRGVQFGELTQEQIPQLGCFIRNHTKVSEMRHFKGDRRKVYDLDYFLDGGAERRGGKERRAQIERRGAYEGE
jgi:hypothetical protein